MTAATTALRQYNPALTSIRGLLALWVVIYHAHLYLHDYLRLPFSYSVLGTFTEKGYLAVDAFFLLSGFILSHVYHHRLTLPTPAKALYLYWWARVGRIFPLHGVVLTAYVTVQLAFNGLADNVSNALFLQQAKTMLLLNYLLLQNWPGINAFSWNATTWSLSTEWFMYFLFPLVLPVIQAIHSQRLLVGCGVVLFGLYHILSHYTGGHTLSMDITTGSLSLARCGLGFLLGTVLFQVLATLPPVGRRVLQQPALGWWLLVAIVASTTVLPLGDWFTVLAMATFIAHLTFQDGAVYHLLCRKPLYWLGEISYSVYLTHVFCFFVLLNLLSLLPVRELPSAWVVTASQVVLLVVILGLSHLTYRFVEVPCREAVKQFALRTLSWKKPWKNPLLDALR